MDSTETILRAFDVITVVALGVFLISSCLIRKPRNNPKMVPFKSLFCSIVSNTIAQGFVVGFDFDSIRSRGASYASCILKSILHSVGRILTFYVFYRIIQNYTARAADGSKKFNAFATVHQGILGILSAISVVEVLLRIISLVPSANHFSHLFGYYGASTARSILHLLASLEIVCVTSLVVKLGASRSRLRTGAMFFIVGGFIFFVFNLSTAISTIRALRRVANLNFDVERTRTRHVFLIINAICTIGVYAGLIGCCMQWHRVGVDAQAVSGQQLFALQPAEHQQSVSNDQTNHPVSYHQLHQPTTV